MPSWYTFVAALLAPCSDMGGDAYDYAMTLPVALLAICAPISEVSKTLSRQHGRRARQVWGQGS